MRPWEKYITPEEWDNPWAHYHAWESWMEERNPPFIPGQLENFWNWWEGSLTVERAPLYAIMCYLADGSPDIPVIQDEEVSVS